MHCARAWNFEWQDANSMRPITAPSQKSTTITVGAVDVETPASEQTQPAADAQPTQTPAQTAAASDPPAPAKQPLYEVITQEQRMAIFLSVFISVFLSALDRTVVTTALPVISRDLNNQTLYAWVRVSLFVVAVCSFPCCLQVIAAFAVSSPSFLVYFHCLFS